MIGKKKTMAKTLEAHDKLIREIFEGSYQFEIPDYQRPYAWTTEQAGELFDDLISAMQDARISGATSQYFLGSIVLIKNDREPKSSVVDGQQRLVPGLEGIGDVLQEDQPERDVLVVAWLHVAAQLVGGLEHIGLEAEVASVAVFGGVVLCHLVLTLCVMSLLPGPDTPARAWRSQRRTAPAGR